MHLGNRNSSRRRGRFRLRNCPQLRQQPRSLGLEQLPLHARRRQGRAGEWRQLETRALQGALPTAPDLSETDQLAEIAQQLQQLLRRRFSVSTSSTTTCLRVGSGCSSGLYLLCLLPEL